MTIKQEDREAADHVGEANDMIAIRALFPTSEQDGKTES